MMTHHSPPRLASTQHVPFSVAFMLFTTSYVLASQKQLTQGIPRGVTYDSCISSHECISPRRCVSSSNITIPCNGKPCACIPPTLRFCTSTGECIPGEVCAKSNNTWPHCASAAIVAAEPAANEFFRDNGTALTGDFCAVSDVCRPPRLCLFKGAVCLGDRPCACSPPMLQFCSSSTQCVSGERCLILADKPICASSSLEATHVEWNSSRGLTGDFCRSNIECAGGRTCGNTGCEENVSCFCKPAAFKQCLRSDHCVDGEICALNPNESQNKACISVQVAPHINFIEVEPSLGLLRDPCFTSEDCKPPRICVGSDLREKCKPGISCFCQAPGVTGCESDSECEDSEICVSGSGRNFCLKESAALEDGFVKLGTNPSSTEAEDTAQSKPPLSLPAIQRRCIASKLLRDLDRDDLVFEEDVLALVLCDSHGNCATPGHVVIFKRKAMMMKSYCSLVGCSKRVMEVNSPKYKRRLRIKGLTSSLELSALAAQYGTRAEEFFITFMMRMGL